MEFDLIHRLQARLAAARDDVVLGIGDDAALLQPVPGQQMVACTDTLVEGVHFLPGTSPADLGWKSLAVNLSDLAAMGADPAWALLALTLPGPDAAWLDAFMAGFNELASAHGLALVGGDTTKGPLAINVTALGQLPPGSALQRSGAQVGDGVYVSGTPGDAAAALQLLQSGANTAQHADLLMRLARPQPRVALGVALRGLASAAIDVSDGLLADLGHVGHASAVAMDVHVQLLPVSAALRRYDMTDTARLALQLGGGDDYELAFCMPLGHEATLAARLDPEDIGFSRIGEVRAGTGVRALDARGTPIHLDRAGWEHFQ